MQQPTPSQDLYVANTIALTSPRAVCVLADAPPLVGNYNALSGNACSETAHQNMVSLPPISDVLIKPTPSRTFQRLTEISPSCGRTEYENTRESESQLQPEISSDSDTEEESASTRS